MIKGRGLDFAKALLIPEHVFPFCLYIVGSVQRLEEEEKRGWGGRERPNRGGHHTEHRYQFQHKNSGTPRIAKATSVPLGSFPMFKTSIAFLMN